MSEQERVIMAEKELTITVNVNNVEDLSGLSAKIFILQFLG